LGSDLLILVLRSLLDTVFRTDTSIVSRLLAIGIELAILVLSPITYLALVSFIGIDPESDKPESGILVMKLYRHASNLICCFARWMTSPTKRRKLFI
jgi:hypothetical protein